KLLSLGEIATIKDAFQSGEMQGRFLGKPALRLKIYRPNSLNDRTLDNLVDKFLGDYQVSIIPKENGAFTLVQLHQKLTAHFPEFHFSKNEKSIRAALALHSGVDFKDLLIPGHRGDKLKLAAIATVEEGFAFTRNTPDKIQVRILNSTSQTVNEGLEVLSSNAWQGFLLVFIILCLFLNARLAFWVALGLPFSCAFCAIVMWYFDASLNMISLFGIVLVLGIVVDDAIVIGENIHRHRLMGKSPLQAAIDGTSEVGYAVLAAVTTTVIAFIPLLFVIGPIGQMAYFIPLTVISTLIASLFEGLFILPAHLSGAPKKPFAPLKKVQDGVQLALKFVIDKIYLPVYHRSLQYRYLSLALCLLLLSLAIIMHERQWLSGSSETEKDSTNIYVFFELPTGSAHTANQKICGLLEKMAQETADELAQNSGAPVLKGLFTMCGKGEGAEHISQIIVTLHNNKQRKIHSNQFLRQWRQKAKTITGINKIEYLSDNGDTTGGVFTMYLSGDNLDQLEKLSQHMSYTLNGIPGVLSSESTITPGKKSLTLELKQQALNLGFTEKHIAAEISKPLRGSQLAIYQRKQDEVQVKLRSSVKNSNHHKLLASPISLTNSPDVYRLEDLVNLKESSGVNTIRRVDGRRFVKIHTFYNPSIITTQQLKASIREPFTEMAQAYPDIDVHFNGMHTSIEDSMTSIYLSAGGAILIIFCIMVMTFHSYLQPLIILFTVPLGFIGAILGHYVLGVTFEVFSMVGIVA
ncbi:MAG: efflux RND transporter permease subunit, partial [Lentisphaeraceae bacterium]|nr:efflux RND transporter permease subunit [Lentisphaeraceae bacterium]